MSRTFKTHHFQRWMRKTDLTDATLCSAVAEMQAGLIDADLGGGVVKKRIALPGHGKSGSTRTLLATNKDDRWFFTLGFEKNERDNISHQELQALKIYATYLLTRTDDQLNQAVDNGSLEEICK
jgi:hypothetical protein